MRYGIADSSSGPNLRNGEIEGDVDPSLPVWTWTPVVLHQGESMLEAMVVSCRFRNRGGSGRQRRGRRPRRWRGRGCGRSLGVGWVAAEGVEGVAGAGAGVRVAGAVSWRSLRFDCRVAGSWVGTGLDTDTAGGRSVVTDESPQLNAVSATRQETE